jgi:hypothetical protein
MGAFSRYGVRLQMESGNETRLNSYPKQQSRQRDSATVRCESDVQGLVNLKN